LALKRGGSLRLYAPVRNGAASHGVSRSVMPAATMRENPAAMNAGGYQALLAATWGWGHDRNQRFRLEWG